MTSDELDALPIMSPLADLLQAHPHEIALRDEIDQHHGHWVTVQMIFNPRKSPAFAINILRVRSAMLTDQTLNALQQLISDGVVALHHDDGKCPHD